MSFLASVGVTNVDLMYVGMPRVPQEGEEIFSQDFRVLLGGGAPGTAVNAARLGIPTRLATYLGSDLFSGFARAQFEQNGVSPYNLAAEGETVISDIGHIDRGYASIEGDLRALGADVWEYPCIATVPIPPCPDVDGALERLSGYEWLALTSPAGADAVWACLEGKGLDARALGGLKLAAIGPGTAKALAGHGLRADYIPEVYDAAHLGAGLPARGRALILRAEMGSPALTEALKGRNIGYDDVACYRTVYENPRSDELRAAVESGAAGIVTFTSASTVKGFVASVGEDADFSRMVGACIGAQTAAEARKHGIPAAVAREATMDALVELITALRD